MTTISTLQNCLDDFLLDQAVRGNSPVTIRDYRWQLGFFVRFAGAELPIHAVTLSLCKNYVLSLRSGSLSSVTIQTYIRALRAFLTWCYDEELLPENIPERLRLPKAQRKVIDILTPTESSRLLSSFDLSSFLGLRNYLICALMLDSGLRLNEVVTLRQDCLHLDDGYIIVLGKGNKQRFVPVGVTTSQALRRYLPYVSASSVSLFVQLDGSPITLTTLKQLFRKLKVEVDIPRLRAHLLRHTFATRYLENGGDIYSLQQILGHTSLEMVKRYLHGLSRHSVETFPRFSPLDNMK